MARRLVLELSLHGTLGQAHRLFWLKDPKKLSLEALEVTQGADTVQLTRSHCHHRG